MLIVGTAGLVCCAVSLIAQLISNTPMKRSMQAAQTVALALWIIVAMMTYSGAR